jgi:AGZA family xanthine/uracil permease-like MFS transporter
VVVAALFALAAFAAPIAGIVPAAATAPALVAVGFLMCKQLTRIDFAAVETALPAFVVAVAIPFTYSISHGIGYGFVTYTVVQLLSGRARSLHPLMIAASVAFAAFLAFG